MRGTIRVGPPWFCTKVTRAGKLLKIEVGDYVILGCAPTERHNKRVSLNEPDYFS